MAVTSVGDFLELEFAPINSSTSKLHRGVERYLSVRSCESVKVGEDMYRRARSDVRSDTRQNQETNIFAMTPGRKFGFTHALRRA